MSRPQEYAVVRLCRKRLGIRKNGRRRTGTNSPGSRWQCGGQGFELHPSDLPNSAAKIIPRAGRCRFGCIRGSARAVDVRVVIDMVDVHALRFVVDAVEQPVGTAASAEQAYEVALE